MSKSSDEIVDEMIVFIEKEEKDLQAAKRANEKGTRTDIVNRILQKLDTEMGDEN
ncbi:hypothetical protein [Ohessyouella blattaphilus]|uniref:Uncharacterized protein n=1 Tax=Ohessyouella blattaphilus TaxID=2949333 RepID=A0ABT1EK25_9FIRM|nr:hypothetical protein [Ohessyouella blattaphilus]MCP1110886.1 hypothetical protein [Ohessyouella blattaphilus]MCR8564280.1 hypothetical protein [Ohessyouella blattaphilus]